MSVGMTGVLAKEKVDWLRRDPRTAVRISFT